MIVISYRRRDPDAEMVRAFPQNTYLLVKDYPHAAHCTRMRVNWCMGLIPFKGLIPVTKQDGHAICIPPDRVL